MNLTLTEAAQLLGKSSRQVRYLIKAGKIQARKVEGRWVFDADALPVSADRIQAKHRKADELNAAVHEALGPHLKPRGHKGYSVWDLVAFRTGTAQARATAARLGHEHAATDALTASLVALAQGCHRFHHREKADAFQSAREHGAKAVAHLYLDGGDAAREIADALEQQYLSTVVGLLRRQERTERR